MSRVLIIGLDHKVQWGDDSGQLRILLSSSITEKAVQLIAEEAFALPTTVGRRIACELGIPWLELDLDAFDRQRKGVADELDSRYQGPLFNGGVIGFESAYLPNADGIREEVWITRLQRFPADSTLVICGALHVDPLVKKLRHIGRVVDVIEAWKLPWHIAQCGILQIVDDNRGRRAQVRDV